MADFYAYRPQPDGLTEPVWREMVELQRQAGATFWRFTIFGPLWPSDIYPHGLYLEGWKVDPGDQGPFDWPMTEAPLSNEGEKINITPPAP